MQNVVISGTLVSDASKQIDRNGRSYSRFTVTCGQTDVNGRTIYTHYRCVCYLSGYDKMKKGDQVFVTGKLSASITITEGNKPVLNMDVMVISITGGYRAADKLKA